MRQAFTGDEQGPAPHAHPFQASEGHAERPLIAKTDDLGEDILAAITHLDHQQSADAHFVDRAGNFHQKTLHRDDPTIDLTRHQ